MAHTNQQTVSTGARPGICGMTTFMPAIVRGECKLLETIADISEDRFDSSEQRKSWVSRHPEPSRDGAKTSLRGAYTK
jgi:hypothetical protein